MIIANPLYDTIFKYLMEDMECARIFLETIIEEEIEELDLAATERTGTRKRAQEPKEKPKEGRGEHEEQEPQGEREAQEAAYILHRIDFAAVIKTRSGERKRVLIEVQKSDNSLDIVRFRKYLGVQYGIEPPLPILSIYLFGFALEVVKDPAVWINRGYTSIATKKFIAGQDPLMELLGHDSYVLQVPQKPRLPHEPLEPIEELLELFNQFYRLETDAHRLNLPRETFDDRFGPLAKRLYKASSNQALYDQLEIDEEAERILLRHHREKLNALEQLKEERKKTKEQQAQLEEKETQLEEKENQLEAKEAQLQEERQRARDKAIESARFMKHHSVSTAEISRMTGLSAEEITAL